MLDYRRAFDKVPFRQMIAKLKSNGIDGRALKWITDWTTNRLKRVVLNGTQSDWEKVPYVGVILDVLSAIGVIS